MMARPQPTRMNPSLPATVGARTQPICTMCTNRSINVQNVGKIMPQVAICQGKYTDTKHYGKIFKYKTITDINRPIWVWTPAQQRNVEFVGRCMWACQLCQCMFSLTVWITNVTHVEKLFQGLGFWRVTWGIKYLNFNHKI